MELSTASNEIRYDLHLGVASDWKIDRAHLAVVGGQDVETQRPPQHHKMTSVEEREDARRASHVAVVGVLHGEDDLVHNG